MILEAPRPRTAQFSLGQRLRSEYEETVKQAVPQQLLALLKALDDAEFNARDEVFRAV
jgi:hypothetical protein